MTTPPPRPTVALAVTCLVDQVAPMVGRAVVEVLHRLGVRVEVPGGQTCCGQPAFNSGYRDEARRAAGPLRQLQRELAARPMESRVAALVVPSGSCALMVRRHFAELFDDADDADATAIPVLEFGEYVAQRLRELGWSSVPQPPPEGTPSAGTLRRVAWHSSCHLLRGLDADTNARELTAAIDGLDVVTLDPRQECCGFGGLFSVKLPEISADMAHGKASAAAAMEVDAVIAGDMGCLLNIGGALRRQGSRVRALHYAQVLAGPAFCHEQ
ncbi:MAG: (Fe-S)-binding protein [Planctomycetota bacterium]